MVVYPEDWVKSTIGECADIYQGGTPSTTNSAYWGGDIVWLTPGEITKLKTLYVNNSERKITQEGLNDSSATLLPAGTILLCTRATIGELAIAAKPVTTNQGFKNLVCKDWIDNRFLAYLLTTYKDEMISRAIGTTFLELSKKELSRLTVYLPPLQEQRAIAETLTAFDDYIADLSALIEKKKAIRDGALEDLVSARTRLDGFTDSWTETNIGACADILQGGTPSTTNSNYWNGDIVWVTPSEITKLKGMYINNSKRRITQAGLQNSSACLLPSGTILLCSRATIGDLAIAAQPMATNQGFKNMICKANVNNVYFAYLLITLKEEMVSRAIGTTFLEISKSKLSAIDVVIPSYIEQQAIASTLTVMDDEINSLETERDKMIQIREGAMDDLLTGHVRLSV